jgi:hypothetical protein
LRSQPRRDHAGAGHAERHHGGEGGPLGGGGVPRKQRVERRAQGGRGDDPDDGEAEQERGRAAGLRHQQEGETGREAYSEQYGGDPAVALHAA